MQGAGAGAGTGTGGGGGDDDPNGHNGSGNDKRKEEEGKENESQSRLVKQIMFKMDNSFRKRKNLMATFSKSMEYILAKYYVYEGDCNIFTEAFYTTHIKDPLDYLEILHKQIRDIDDWTENMEEMINKAAKLIKIGRARVD